MRSLASLAAVLFLGLSPDTTPAPSATVTPAPPPQMIDLRMLRYKISAGDLYSAESILETHRAESGEECSSLHGHCPR